MERASRALLQLALGAAALPLSRGARILVGKGNNGGDGLALGRHLSGLGFSVQILLLAGPPGPAATGDADVNHWLAAARRPAPGNPAVTAPLTADFLQHLPPFPGLWVDALLGTGFQGCLRPDLEEVVRALNARGELVLAVDVPSGLDARTGLPGPVAVRAQHTGTLGADKVGFGATSAREWAGTVHVLDIGWPVSALQRLTQRSSEGP